MALGQPMRAQGMAGGLAQERGAQRSARWGARQRPAGPPGQMKTAGPPAGAFAGLAGSPGRLNPGGRPMPPQAVARGIPGGETGDMGANPWQQRLQVQRAAGVFDKPQPVGPDPREMAMQRQQAVMGNMDRFQRPAPPPGMDSVQPPGMRPGFDPAMMQQRMAQANQMRDQWRQANPNPVMNQMPAGRPMPDIDAMRQRVMQQRQMQGPIYD